jgi:hypothetical protein
MNPIASPRHPFKAAVALLVTAAAVHGVCAHAGTRGADVARVDVVGQLPLSAACPDVDTADLADELAPAWRDAARPSAVAVRFTVQGGHVYDVVPDTASPRTFHQIRRAVHGLSCDAGDDEAHAVRLLVRFVDDDAAGSRVAGVVVADDPDGR